MDPKKKHNSTAPPRRPREKRKRTPLPDLHIILGAFSDAYALIAVAATAIDGNPGSGPEHVVLRMGVESLDRVYNDLDTAIVQLSDLGVAMSRRATPARAKASPGSFSSSEVCHERE